MPSTPNHLSATRRRYALAVLFALASAALIPLASGCGRYADDAGNTLFRETKASSLLAKYTWFKDANAALDAKKADIRQFERKIGSLKSQYEGVARKDWAREDLTSINQWEGELDGMKASYNGLAAEYNAAMAKANWRFTNVGDLPAGASEPLPRTVKPYIDGQ